MSEIPVSNTRTQFPDMAAELVHAILRQALGKP